MQQQQIEIQATFRKWREWADKEEQLKAVTNLFQLRRKSLNSSPKKTQATEMSTPNAAETKAHANVDSPAVFASGNEKAAVERAVDSPKTFPLAKEDLDPALFTSGNEKAAVERAVPVERAVDLSKAFFPEKTFFLAKEDLPSDLASHKDRVTIEALLDKPMDPTLTRWRRRTAYTEENFDEWAEWAPVEKTHLDAFKCMKEFNKEKLLIAPDLRDSSTRVIAEAWNTYRKHMLYEIPQALTLGCKWKTILTKLHLAFSDPVIGYPRLQLAVDLALKDSELMKYPLLHADVLIYKLDESFAEGNQKYSNDSSSANWDQTTSRLPGESAHSLSIRVENAYLELHEELDAVSIYLPGYSADQLIGRYCECLYNDPSDPDRGERSAHEAKLGWDKDMAAYRFPGSVPKDPPTLERIARFWVAPTEASYKPEPDQGRLEAIDEYPNSKPLALGYNAPEKPVMPVSRGNHAERRRESRAHLQPGVPGTGYHAEPPPPQYYSNHE